jgi:hypothetical protein
MKYLYKPLVINQLKDAFNDIGFKVQYRNRYGKQYLSVQARSSDGWDRIRKMCQNIFRQNKIERYHSTSGSYKSVIYRINPEL